MKSTIGFWSFMIGLVLSAIVAIFNNLISPTIATLIIAILGIIVGLINITDKEVMLFLVAAISFLLSFSVLSSVIQTLALGWGAVATFFNMMAVFIAPAAAIVAVQALYKIAKN